MLTLFGLGVRFIGGVGSDLAPPSGLAALQRRRSQIFRTVLVQD